MRDSPAVALHRHRVLQSSQRSRSIHLRQRPDQQPPRRSAHHHNQQCQNPPNNPQRNSQFGPSKNPQKLSVEEPFHSRNAQQRPLPDARKVSGSAGAKKRLPPPEPFAEIGRKRRRGGK